MTDPMTGLETTRTPDPRVPPGPECPPTLADPARLASLAATGLVDSAPEYAFDRLTELACRVLRAPVALVSLVTDERQFFKSSVGVPAPWHRGTPLSHSFCRYVVQRAAPLVVADALADPGLRDSPAVRDLGARAYAGVPLTAPDGQILGSFCVIDTQPRAWTDEEVATLRVLADSVETEIGLRQAVREAEARTAEADRLREEAARRAREAAYQAREARRARRELEALLEATDEGLCGVDADGHCTFINPAAARLLGYAPGEVLGENLHRLIHHHRPDGSPYPEADCPILRGARAGEGARVAGEVFFRRDGRALPVDYSVAPLVEDGAPAGAVLSFSGAA